MKLEYLKQKYYHDFTFWKRLNISSLIANQVKTNMCSDSVKLSLSLSLLLFHCSHLTETTITACSTQLFAILLTNATLSISRNFTQDWLNYYWLLPVLSFYARLLPQNILKVKGSWSHLRGNSIVNACICAFPILVVDLFGSCSIYLCILYTLTFVTFSISFILMVFIFFETFAYYFHVNAIKLLRFCVTISFQRKQFYKVIAFQPNGECYFSAEKLTYFAIKLDLLVNDFVENVKSLSVVPFAQFTLLFKCRE